MSGTAEVHPGATLTPSKLDLLQVWMPAQPWFACSEVTQLARVASYRFVDHMDEVGIETLLVSCGSFIYQVPLTYRDEPLEDGEDYLIGEMEHSVLGHRWVYDAVGDPVYLDELNRVIREADCQAELSSGAQPDMTVEGSGVVLVSNSTGHIKLHRQLYPAKPQSHVQNPIGTLTGTWTDENGTHTELLARLL